MKGQSVRQSLASKKLLKSKVKLWLKMLNKNLFCDQP